MDLEKIIIQTLIEYQFGDNLKNGDYVTGVKKMYFGEVAALVVKKYNDIHNVVNRRELLLDFADYSESDKTSQTTDECVDNYLDSIK